MKSSVEKKLKPELLARINEVIVFNDLEDTDFKNIIKKELSTLSDKFRHKNIKLNINNNCVQFLLNKIKLKKLHARSIKDAVKQEVTIPCAKFIIENPKKREILIKVVDKQLVIN